MGLYNEGDVINSYLKAGPAVLLLFLLFAPPVSADIELFSNDLVTMNFYGYFKVNTIFIDNETNSVIAARWPMPDSPEYNKNQFAITPTDTRFGFKPEGPEISGDFRIYGRFEGDFFTDVSRNSPRPRLRHAFIEIKNDKHSFLAGLYWDFFAGGVLRSWLINGFYAQTGNMGFRRAQLWYKRTFDNGMPGVSLSDPTSDEGTDSGVPIATVRGVWDYSEGVCWAFPPVTAGRNGRTTIYR